MNIFKDRICKRRDITELHEKILGGPKLHVGHKDGRSLKIAILYKEPIHENIQRFDSRPFIETAY